MIVFNEVIRQVEGISAEELDYFIAHHWVEPFGEEGDYRFSDIDVARIRLIWELRYRLLVEEESLSIILSLLDQLYSTRRQLKALIKNMHQMMPEEEDDHDKEISI